MNKYNYTVIEGWWRHNGIWDREEICQNYGILYEDFDGEQQIFLEVTDNWWDGLTDEELEEAIRVSFVPSKKESGAIELAAQLFAFD